MKPMIFLLVLFSILATCPRAAAQQGISVIVETVNPVKNSEGKDVFYFQGTLTSPTSITLGDAELDLNYVVHLRFPVKLSEEIEKKLADAQKAAMPDEKQKEILNQYSALKQTKAVTLYKQTIYTGNLAKDATTKADVQFRIIKTVGTQAEPATLWTADKLKAIHFRPAAPPKAGAANQPMGAGTAWTTISADLRAVKAERQLLAEQFVHVSRKRLMLPEGTVDPITQADVHARLRLHEDALREAIRQKDMLIDFYQTQLALLPRPILPVRPVPYPAFVRTPHVREIREPETDTTSGMGTTPSPTTSAPSGETGSMESESPFEFRFAQAAQFPLPRFGAICETLETDGVIIYEGMRFKSQRDGKYEVNFTTSVPAMPVTLRLQLVIAGDDGVSFALTLPPISIDPGTDFKGNYLGSSFQVRHTGYSQMVALSYAAMPYATIARNGTARFGSWPEGINQYGILKTPPEVSTEVAPQ